MDKQTSCMQLHTQTTRSATDVTSIDKTAGRESVKGFTIRENSFEEENPGTVDNGISH